MQPHHAFIDKTWMDWLRANGLRPDDDNQGLSGFEDSDIPDCVVYEEPVNAARRSTRPEHAAGNTSSIPWFELGQMKMPFVMFQSQRRSVEEICGSDM